MISRVLALTVLWALITPGQSRFLLTIDNIMRGPQLYGYAPQDLRWSGDGERIYFRWKQASDPQDKPFDTWVLQRASGYARKLSDDDAKLAPPVNGASTRDRSKTVYVRDGDLFLYDFKTDKVAQLTKTAETEKDPYAWPAPHRP